MAVTINGNNTPTAGGVVYGDGSTYASTTAGSAGSVLYSAGASAPAFTAVGTASQVLQSNGASAPSWVTLSSGGGMTLLSTTTLSGSSTTISVASGYIHLYIVSFGMTLSTNAELYFRVNSITSGYDLTGTNARSTSVNNNLNDSIWSGAPGMASRLSSSTANIDTFFIQNYDSSSMFKMANLTAGYLDNASTTQFGSQTALLRNTAAITSVSLFPNTGTFSGGTVLIYGVK